MTRWGIWSIALMYLLEGMAVPWPIEIPLWLSGSMLQHQTASYWQLVLVTWAGTSLGNLIAFATARLGGRPLLLLLSQRFRLQTQLQQGERWINKYGLATVIFTRWINWGFGLSLWFTGFSDVPPYRAVSAMLINNALWSFAWVELGRVLIAGLSQAGLPGWLTLLPGGIGLVGLGAWRLWRQKHLRAAK